MPHVAAERLTRHQRLDHPVRQRPRRAFAPFEGVGDRVDDLNPYERIALRCVVEALAHVHVVAASAVLTRASPLGGSALRVDHANLPALPSFVRGHDLIHGLLRRHSLGQEVQQVISVFQPRAALRGDGADPWPHPRYGVAHARAASRDDGARFPSSRIDGHDRERGEWNVWSSAPRSRLLAGHGRGHYQWNDDAA